MEVLENDLLEQDTPVVFTDGTAIYHELKRRYIIHNQGLFSYRT